MALTLKVRIESPLQYSHPSLTVRAPPATLAPLMTDAPYDIIIRGGEIIDGTGAPRYAADLAVRDRRIAAIGAVEGPVVLRQVPPSKVAPTLRQ